MSRVKLTQKAGGTQAPLVLRRAQVRDALLRNLGSQAAIAREMGVSRTAVHNVLAGHAKSQRIFDAAHKRAIELLAQEAREGKTA